MRNNRVLAFAPNLRLRSCCGLLLLFVLVVPALGPSRIIARLYANLGSVSLARSLTQYDVKMRSILVASDLSPVLRSDELLADADSKFGVALDLHPQDARTLLMKGVLHLMLAEYEEASSLLTQAADLAPGDSMIPFYQGALYYLSGQSENAVRFWQRSRGVDFLLFRLGLDFIKQQDYEQGFMLWRLAERVDPTPKHQKQHMYWFMCDIVSLRQEDWKGALYWCEQAVAADPLQHKRLALARAYVGTGNVADAELIAESVLASGGTSPGGLGAAHWVLAGVHTYQGRFDEALWEFSMAIDLLGENKFVYLDLARLYLRIGQLNEAAQALQLVQRLDLDSGVLTPRVRELQAQMELLHDSLDGAD